MPKKTRQEKILAKLKRLEKTSEPPIESHSSTPLISVSTNLKSLETTGIVSETPTVKVSSDYSYVYKDLTKTIIFAVVAIVFQIILSRFI